ncbi:MAG: glycosyltransferase family 39 protein [Candidatus Ratteibacteria bacterium]|nr:glycosyltransferase family 39 protein [Candidatus Ratteibacteria bacterium]
MKPTVNNRAWMLFLIALLYFVVIFLRLDEGSLADWDEATYAEISKEILQTGDWVTLHHDFNPWFYKPPLLFYLVAITYKFIGISTFSSRFWPALFGLATLMATFFLAEKLFNNKVALLSSLILLTSPQFLHKSRMLMLDVPVTFFIVLSLYLFVLTQEKREFYYLLGVSLGLGVMTKGPVGLFPIFIILLYLFLTKNFKAVADKNYFRTLMSFLIVALPWYLIQIILHGSNFINNFFLGQIFKRATTAIEMHNYGNLFYLFVIKNGLYLWFYLLLISLCVILYKHKKTKSNPFLLSWIIVIFGVFLIAKTKLPWYLIPLYPAFAISISSVFYGLTFRKIPAGLYISIIIFLCSLHIPEPLFCNNFLKAVNIIARERLTVDVSVKRSSAELFYLGPERLDISKIENKNGFFLSSCDGKAGQICKGEKYIFFAEGNYIINKADWDAISKIPDSQTGPVKYCYAFMPGNLGVYYGNYLIRIFNK